MDICWRWACIFHPRVIVGRNGRSVRINLWLIYTKIMDAGMGLQMPFGGDDGRSPEMGLKMPSGRYDEESSKMGLKMPYRGCDFPRYSLVGIPIHVVEEESAEECWSLSWEKWNFRNFSCPFLYWGIIS